MSDDCSACRYFLKTRTIYPAGYTGRCVRYPPTRNAATGAMNEGSNFPLVGDEWWCGEYQTGPVVTPVDKAPGDKAPGDKPRGVHKP